MTCSCKFFSLERHDGGRHESNVRLVQHLQRKVGGHPAGSDRGERRPQGRRRLPEKRPRVVPGLSRGRGGIPERARR
jgi:hypothetical protein